MPNDTVPDIAKGRGSVVLTDKKNFVVKFADICQFNFRPV